MVMAGPGLLGSPLSSPGRGSRSRFGTSQPSMIVLRCQVGRNVPTTERPNYGILHGAKRLNRLFHFPPRKAGTKIAFWKRIYVRRM